MIVKDIIQGLNDSEFQEMNRVIQFMIALSLVLNALAGSYVAMHIHW